MSNKQKEYRVFVVGPSKGYGRWIEGSLTEDMRKSDVVLFTGGEDISPSIYGEPVGKRTSIWVSGGGLLPARDRLEIDAFEKAKALGKPMWGTCRGAQLLCALAGGKLIQDMNHYGSHPLHFYDKDYTCHSNSLHHQMQYPYNMKKDEDYVILAHTHGISDIYLDGNNKGMHMPENIWKTSTGSVIKEPEFVYYPKLKALGIQGHPEMMSDKADMVQVCHAFLNLLIEGHIDDVLTLNLKVKDIISRAWNFKLTDEEKQLLPQVKPRKLQTKAEVDTSKDYLVY